MTKTQHTEINELCYSFLNAYKRLKTDKSAINESESRYSESKMNINHVKLKCK